MEFTKEQLEAIEYNARDDDSNAWVSRLNDGTHFAFTVSSLAAFALDLLERAEAAEAERDILAWANRNMAGEPVKPDPRPEGEASNFDAPFNIVYDNGVAAACDAGDAGESWSVNSHLDGERVVSEVCFTVPGFADDELRRRVMAAARKPDPIRLAESAYRETEAELREMGERIAREGFGGDACECSKREPKGEWVGDREWEEDCGCDCGIVRIPESPERPHDSLVWAIMYASPDCRDADEADGMLEDWRERWSESEEDSH